jgi:Coenzyme PQQ synthesis protein D (PqqD)
LIADGRTQQGARFLGKFLRRSVGSARLFPPPKTGARELNTENRSWAAVSEVRTSVHEDGLALLHIPTGRMFLCNRTGARIWQGIVKGLSIEAIAEEISCECGVAHALVEQHTSSFLAELESRGLVTRRTGG